MTAITLETILRSMFSTHGTCQSLSGLKCSEVEHRHHPHHQQQHHKHNHDASKKHRTISGNRLRCKECTSNVCIDTNVRIHILCIYIYIYIYTFIFVSHVMFIMCMLSSMYIHSTMLHDNSSPPHPTSSPPSPVARQSLTHAKITSLAHAYVTCTCKSFYYITCTCTHLLGGVGGMITFLGLAHILVYAWWVGRVGRVGWVG